MLALRLPVAEIREGEEEIAFSIKPEELDLSFSGAEFLHPVEVKLIVRRFGLEISIFVFVKTKISLNCARCLKRFDYDFASRFDLFVKLQRGGPVFADFQDNDFEFGNDTNSVIDIAERVRAELILDSPSFPLCDENCPGIEYPSEVEPRVDSRWGGLSSLKFEKEEDKSIEKTKTRKKTTHHKKGR